MLVDVQTQGVAFALFGEEGVRAGRRPIRAGQGQGRKLWGTISGVGTCGGLVSGAGACPCPQPMAALEGRYDHIRSAGTAAHRRESEPTATNRGELYLRPPPDPRHSTYPHRPERTYRYQLRLKTKD